MNVRIILRRQRGKEFKIKVREPSVSYHGYSEANELINLWLSKHSKQFIKHPCVRGHLCGPPGSWMEVQGL